MQYIERRKCEFRDLIQDQERAAESMLQTLEQEITELKQRDHELEMLLKSEDHVHVLQATLNPVLTEKYTTKLLRMSHLTNPSLFLSLHRTVIPSLPAFLTHPPQ